MSRLRPEKLHVHLAGDTLVEGPVVPRRYTLTHSDTTGDLFLTIGPEYDREQVSGWHTRLMRDEVLAEWLEGTEGPSLHVYCHVSGGVVFGNAAWRYGIFQRELPLVLESLRFGDQRLFEARPELENAPIRVHFRSGHSRYSRTQDWGVLRDYRLGTSPSVAGGRHD